MPSSSSRTKDDLVETGSKRMQEHSSPLQINIGLMQPNKDHCTMAVIITSTA